MKVACFSFSAGKVTSVTVPKLVSAQAICIRFRAVPHYPMADHLAPSRLEYGVLLTLFCLYLILASVVCWILVEGIQQYLLDAFNRTDNFSFHGPR